LEVSRTVTEKEQLTARPELSMTVAWTGVVPMGKLVPDAGLYTTDDIPQLSLIIQLG
jgi:hypothetical protein